jgi:two-component system sensor histidine kinase/response regulator
MWVKSQVSLYPKGDKQRCLDAGMDDYLSKPISPEKLYLCMQSWLLKDNKQVLGALSSMLNNLADSIKDIEPSQVQVANKQLNKRSFNDVIGLSALDGSRELYNDVLGMFLEKYQHINRVELLLLDDDAQDLRRFFHTIKGLAATIGAESLQQIATILELQYESDNNAALSVTVESFVNELAKVCGDIKSYLT